MTSHATAALGKRCRFASRIMLLPGVTAVL
jgi:hypothetical protein